MNELRFSIATLRFDLPIREELFDGRKHLVVPVVALVEGVHAGSMGPVFHPAEEIAKYVDCWNGIPIPIFHPQDESGPVSVNDPRLIEEKSVGRFFNAHFDPDGSKLKGEFWIDISKAETIAPEILSMIRSGQDLEVSTAMWWDADWVAGTWNGEEYEATVRNYRPDHIALLPGGTGACSWEDGCGVRVNKKPGGGKQMDDNKGIKEKFKSIFRSAGEFLGLVAQESSHDEIRNRLIQAVDALDNGSWIHFVKEIFDDWFVYEARSNNPSETGQSSGAAKLYKRGYSVDEKGLVELKDDTEEVIEKKEYVSANLETTKKEVTGMDKEKVVQELIACERTKFTDEHKDWLMTLSEDQLKVLQVEEEKKPEEKKETTKPAGTLEKKPEVKKEEKKETDKEPVTLEDFIGKAPTELQSTLKRAVERDQAVKDELVKALLANERNKFTEEELNKKDIGELQNLAELARVEVNFELQSGGPSSSNKDDDKIPDMPLVFEEAKKE